MLNLTAQQIKVFDVIKESLQSNGYPPTRAERSGVGLPNL